MRKLSDIERATLTTEDKPLEFVGDRMPFRHEGPSVDFAGVVIGESAFVATAVKPSLFRLSVPCEETDDNLYGCEPFVDIYLDPKGSLILALHRRDYQAQIIQVLGLDGGSEMKELMRGSPKGAELVHRFRMGASAHGSDLIWRDDSEYKLALELYRDKIRRFKAEWSTREHRGALPKLTETHCVIQTAFPSGQFSVRGSSSDAVTLVQGWTLPKNLPLEFSKGLKKDFIDTVNR